MRFLSLLLVILVAFGVVAQEEGDDELLSIYDDIPQYRAEDGAFVLGYEDAPVTVIEFADYLCGHCQTYEQVTDRFIQEYVATGQAKFEYRGIPIIDQNYSPLLMAMTECAWEEGLYWPARSLLFGMAFNGEIGQDIGEVFSERMGIPLEELAGCLSSADQFSVDMQLANELGVTGTPAVRVQVGDGPRGVIEINGSEYDRGGPPFEILAQFVESENPAEMVALVNRLRDADMLSDDSLLTSEPCGAPCWRGITPGETTWEEALAILEDDAELEIAQTQEAQDGAAKLAVVTGPSGEACCQFYTETGETMTAFRLLLAPDNVLGDLLDVYGEPDFLNGAEFTSDQAYFDLYYIDEQMVVSVFVAGTEEGALSADSEIIGVQYMTPDQMATLTEGESLLLWQGFLSYQEYVTE